MVTRNTKTTAAAAAGANTAAAAVATVADPVAARLADLQQSIAVTQSTVDRLQGLPPEEVAALPLKKKQDRAHALSDAFLSLETLENAKLQVLNDEFEARLPNLKWATAKLAEDLARLTDTVAIIGAAASAIGIVADIVSIA